MAKGKEAVLAQPTTDTGEVLLESLQSAVTTLAMFEAAMKFAKLYQRNPNSPEIFTEGLNAFLGFAQSNALDDGNTPVWRKGEYVHDVVDSQAVARTVRQLDGRQEVIRRTIEQTWIRDVEKGWEGRKLTSWRPLELDRGSTAIIGSQASLSMGTVYGGETEHTLITGVVVSGEVYAIDPGEGGSIGLRDGVYRQFDFSRGRAGSIPILNPEPMAERSFDEASIDHLFDNTQGLWLSRVALREVYNLSELVHPEMATV